MEVSIMKHSNIILTLAAVLIADMALVSCNKESLPVTGTFTMTVNAARGYNATKALSVDGTTLTASWVQGDSVKVYNETRLTDLEGSLVAQSDGSSIVFAGTLSGEIAVGDILILKYLNPDYSGQDGTLEYIAANCDYALATVTVASVANGKISTSGDADFENQQAIAKFTMGNSEGTEMLSASQILVSVGDDSYTVTPTSATKEIYLALPGFSGQDITISATVGTNFYSFTKSDVTFEAGQYYAIEVQTKLVSVTWDSDEEYGHGGISISGCSYGADNGIINMSVERSGITFTSIVGSIASIVINCDHTDFTPPAGWSWNSGNHTLVWTGTPSASVSLITGAESAIYDIKSIVFKMGD